MRLGRNQEAYADLSQAVSLKPDNSDYQANLGYVLWKLGKPEEAVAAERAALKLDGKIRPPTISLVVFCCGSVTVRT